MIVFFVPVRKLKKDGCSFFFVPVRKLRKDGGSFLCEEV